MPQGPGAIAAPSSSNDGSLGTTFGYRLRAGRSRGMPAADHVPERWSREAVAELLVERAEREDLRLEVRENRAAHKDTLRWR